MFKSVIERQRAGRLGTGVWVSTGVHAALFVAVLFISARTPEVEEPPEKDLVLSLVPKPGPVQPKGTPPAVQPQKPAAAKPARPRRDRVPTQVQPLKPEPLQPEPDPSPATGSETDEVGTPGDGPGGHPDGDPNAIGVPYIPGLEPGQGGTGTDVLPFGAGMTPPSLVGGPNITYTEEARIAGVEGVMIAKCVITEEGRVRNCRIIKGLPHMDEAVMDALEARRYRPVMFQGKSVTVSYVFTLRLKIPR